MGCILPVTMKRGTFFTAKSEFQDDSFLDTKFPNDFVLDDFLQPLENSRAAREFSGILPENSFTGSGHWIKNSGSSDETRRNSRSFPYMYESSALSELETFCSFPDCTICE